jgi:CheY-like chemotaxis protein
MPAPRRALIVDDDPMFVIILTRILSRFELTIDTCGSAQEAIRSLQGRDYDLVLLDLRLTGSDGGTVIEYLKRAKPHTLPHTIVLTSFPVVARAFAPDIPMIDKGNLSALPERVGMMLGDATKPQRGEL